MLRRSADAPPRPFPPLYVRSLFGVAAMIALSKAGSLSYQDASELLVRRRAVAQQRRLRLLMEAASSAAAASSTNENVLLQVRLSCSALAVLMGCSCPFSFASSSFTAC